MTKLSLGQLNVGEGILKKYLALVPENPQATRLIATSALQQHDPTRAIDYLTPLVEKLPPDSTSLTLLGNAYMADGKPELALQHFEKAAALDPENAALKTRVAIAEIGTGKGREGLEQLEQVFNGQAGPAIAGPTLVLAELRAGRVDKAAEVAASLIRQDADNPLYQVLLGEVRVAQRDDEGAKTAFYAALTKNPEFAAAARDLALLYVRGGRIDDAKKVYSDLLARKPTDTTALLGLADIAISEKRWPETVGLLNQARAASKFDPAAGLKLIQLDEQRGDWNSAKAVAAELYALFPRDVNVAVALGRARLGSGDTIAAISAFKLAHQLKPDSAPIRSSYVALLTQAKFYREAFDVLQEAVIREPQNASLKAELIRVDAEVDGIDGALSRAREFAASDPGSSIYDLVSAELYEKAGRVADAAALLEKALAVRAADDELAVGLSRLYARTGDLGKAEALLTTRLRTDPNNIAATSALAPLYLMTGRPSDAKKAYANVLLQRPDDFPALIGLADIAVGERQWPDAVDYLKRARRAAPNDPSPGIRLVNLYGLRRDWKNANGEKPWESIDDILLADWLQRRDIMVAPHTAGQAAYAVGFDNKFHPVRDYLLWLRWDGTPRLDTWLVTYLGAKVAPVEAGNQREVERAIAEQDYLAAIGSKFLIAMVARVERPGCKADCAIVLQGPQGILKSSALLALMPCDEWFTDELADLGTKDAALQLAGRWLVEWSELDSYGRAEISRVKAYMSRQADKFRPPYGQHVVSRRRQCCFAGSVNPPEFLRDETGARRFWPLACGRIDIDRIKRDRDQLWAEASHRFKRGEKWWLDATVDKQAKIEQEARRIQDPWEEKLADALELTQPKHVTIPLLLTDVLAVETRLQDQRAANRVAACLQALGWERKRLGKDVVVRINGTESHMLKRGQWTYLPDESGYTGYKIP